MTGQGSFVQITTRARAPASQDQQRCPYCLDDLDTEDHVDCDRCGTPHHLTCFQAHGSCTVLGCNGRPKDDASHLSSELRRQLLDRAFSEVGYRRARAVERLALRGVPMSEVEEHFGRDPDGQVRASVLGAQLRHGDARALVALLELARSRRATTVERRAALRALAMQAEIPLGAVGAAVFCFGERELRGRASWILREVDDEHLLELLREIEEGHISSSQGLELLVACYHGLENEARVLRLALLEKLQTRAPGALTEKLLEAAVAKDALLRLPAAPLAPALGELKNAAVMVAFIGFLLGVLLITLGSLMAGGGSKTIPTTLVWLGRLAFSLTALVGGGMGLVLSQRGNRYQHELDLHERERDRVTLEYRRLERTCGQLRVKGLRKTTSRFADPSLGYSTGDMKKDPKAQTSRSPSRSGSKPSLEKGH